MLLRCVCFEMKLPSKVCILGLSNVLWEECRCHRTEHASEWKDIYIYRAREVHDFRSEASFVCCRFYLPLSFHSNSPIEFVLRSMYYSHFRSRVFKSMSCSIGQFVCDVVLKSCTMCLY